MSQISSFIKKFYLWNFISLVLLCLLLRAYHTEVSWLEWPVNSCLSLLVLSSVVFHFSNRIISAGSMFMVMVFFSISHWILTGFFEVLLTRFLRLPESYSLTAFEVYLRGHHTLILDGFIGSLVYLILFAWFRSLAKAVSLSEVVEELEKELGQVDLKALDQEMSPHFLFNAMNGISMKIRMEQNREAVKMVAALTDLLRLNLSRKDDLLISLKDEIELLNKGTSKINPLTMRCL